MDTCGSECAHVNKCVQPWCTNRTERAYTLPERLFVIRGWSFVRINPTRLFRLALCSVRMIFPRPLMKKDLSRRLARPREYFSRLLSEDGEENGSSRSGSEAKITRDEYVSSRTSADQICLIKTGNIDDAYSITCLPPPPAHPSRGI